MPIVEITGPAFPQDAKDRLAKKITQVVAEEEKKPSNSTRQASRL